MEPQFSWDSFDRIAKTLQSLGYVLIVFGPIIGCVLLVMGDTVIRLSGLVVIAASVFVALYHISFLLLMTAVHDLTKHISDLEKGHPTA